MARNIIKSLKSDVNHIETPDGIYTARSYLIMETHLAGVMNLMTNSTFITNSDLLFGKPSEYVLSVRYYPLKLDALLGIAVPLNRLEEIYFGGHQYHDVLGLPLTNDEYTYGYDAGSILVKRKFNNFADYQTRLRLYIPYLNFIELDARLCMGKYLHFYYTFDFYNGMFTVFIVLYPTLADDTAGTNGTMIRSETQKIAIDIPFGSTNANDIAKNIYASIFDMGIGVVKGIIGFEGGDSKAVSKGVGDVYGGIKNIFNQQERFSRGGAPSGSYNNLHSPTSIYLEYCYPNLRAIDSNWVALNGYPAEKNATLSTLSGYNEIGNIEFNAGNADIYNDEIEEIVTLLKNGVIL